MWTSWLNGILGIWIIIVPFINMSASAFKTTLVISGIVIALLGFAGAASGNRVNRAAM